MPSTNEWPRIKVAAAMIKMRSFVNGAESRRPAHGPARGVAFRSRALR